MLWIMIPPSTPNPAYPLAWRSADTLAKLHKHQLFQRNNTLNPRNLQVLNRIPETLHSPTLASLAHVEVASGKLNLAFSGVTLLTFMMIHLYQFRLL